MRDHLLLPVLCLALLCGCASAPAEAPQAPSEAPAATQAAGATVAAEPSAAPSPAATQLPYRGPNPRLAIVSLESDGLIIQVIELGSEEVVATVPVEDSWKMALSPDASKLFNFTLTGAGMIYDLDSVDSQSLDLAEFVQGGDYLNQAVWAPSQQWLSFDVQHNNGRRSLWV